NAIKFTERGEVVLQVRLAKDASRASETFALHFRVIDSGVDLPPDKQRQIFDPFSQADGSTTRKYGGTGLGLTISSRLVGMMGGRLDVDSVLGEGSTFHFVGNDPGLLREVLEAFLEDTPRMLAQVRDAPARQGAAALTQSAHSLRGSLL